MPRPPIARTFPDAVAEDVVAVACQVRIELIRDGWDAGPISVAHVLRDRGIEPPSRASLARIFTRAGMVTPQPQKRPRATYQRFVYPLPNGCWQMDALEVPLLDGKATVFQLEDDHSRLMIASRAAVSENSIDAIAVVTTGIARHGIPQRLLTDNGVALNQNRRGSTAALTEYANALGIDTITGRPNKPTTQGKNERVHQTLLRFLAARPRPADLPALQTLLDEFDEHYNHQRRHQAINGKTPAEAYTALPKATPPTPPSGQIDLMRRTDRVVDARGSIYVAGRQFQYGTDYRGKTVTVLHDDHTFHLADHHGTIIDTHTNPARGTYIPRNRHQPQETEPSPKP